MATQASEPGASCLSRYARLWSPPQPRPWTWVTDDQVGDITPYTITTQDHKLTSSATTGSSPCGRHRDPTIHTPVRHVANAEPDIRCTGWNRDIGRPDEVHVRPPSPLRLLPCTPSLGSPPNKSTVIHSRPQTNEYNRSYKGMAQATPTSTKRDITPQPTGFSQVHTRGGGEGGGQAMSVLLSWHEKVRPYALSSLLVIWNTLPTRVTCPQSATILHISTHRFLSPSLTRHQLVEIAGPGSISRVMSDRRTV